jgi:hypothetical protein
MGVFEIISPILILVLLGVALARWHFLGAQFMGDLNRLTFWVALPVTLFRATAVSGDPGPEAGGIYCLVLCATLLAAMAGWLASSFIGLPLSSRGTVAQSAFRGNLAYIGLPLLSYAFQNKPAGSAYFATAVVTMAFLTATYNVLAVIVLQASRHQLSWESLKPGFRAIITNPLLISCAAGLLFHAAHLKLPVFIDRTLETLGSAAVPMALLCIGGAIAFIELGKNTKGMAVAVMLKLAILPAIVFLIGKLIGFDLASLRIAMVFSSCPTAAASFVMARQMEGDESVASGSIVLSTIFSIISLPLALLLTEP